MNRRSVAALLGGALAGVTGWDLTQRRHAILRNYSIVGHLRYLLEAVGPELRQSIVTDNDAERPFSRDQRRWVYTSARDRPQHQQGAVERGVERGPGGALGQRDSAGPGLQHGILEHNQLRPPRRDGS